MQRAQECSCTQNHKGDRFELDVDGEPLLIDPTAEDPWDFLFFDSKTGFVTARFPATENRSHPKGEYTTHEKTLPLNIEAITEGRKRTTRGLRRVVQSFLKGFLESPARAAEAERALVEVIQDVDSHGLATWFFLREGRHESPFRELESDHGAIWQAVVRCLAQGPRGLTNFAGGRRDI